MKYISYSDPYRSEPVCYMYKRPPPPPQVKLFRSSSPIQKYDYMDFLISMTNKDI